ncbi:MAG: PAP2 family protein [Bacteroidetes bacterium]|nr:MAG: PAP2 family protein [Bacteroidota bacterium]
MDFKFLFCTLLLCSQLTFSQTNNGINTSGDILLFAMPIAAAGSTLLIGDKDGSIQFLKGFVLNEAITLGLKLAIDKERPDGSNTNSFPSGHTSTTFQAATFIQKRYGLKFGIPAYLLASYTGFTRIYTKKHYFLDVLAGAVIGVGSSFLFTTPYLKEHLELTLSNSENNYLLGFKYKF